MLKKITLSFVLALFLSSCFGGGAYEGSVLGYYNQIVKTKGGSFKIGTLPNYWKQQKRLKYHAILFANQRDQSTITVDSWCQPAVDDDSLENLMVKLFRGIDHYKKNKSEELRLSDRAALRQDGEGAVDGHEVYMSATVLNMNTCVYDFIYVTTPGQLDYYDDYIAMVNGFQYLSGPKIITK